MAEEAWVLDIVRDVSWSPSRGPHTLTCESCGDELAHYAVETSEGNIYCFRCAREMDLVW